MPHLAPESIYALSEFRPNNGDLFLRLFQKLPTNQEVDDARIGRILQGTAANLTLEQLKGLIELSKNTAVTLLENGNYIAAPSWANLCHRLDLALIIRETEEGKQGEQ